MFASNKLFDNFTELISKSDVLSVPLTFILKSVDNLKLGSLLMCKSSINSFLILSTLWRNG